MFKKVCFIFLNLCWQTAAVVLIVLALLVTFARFMMPSLNEYKDSIETTIEQQIGMDISIGAIEGTWDSIGPVIEIKNLHLGYDFKDPSAVFTFIQSIKLSVAPFQSLFYRTLITDSLTIDGLSLVINQQQNSEFILTNIKQSKAKSTEIDPALASSIQDWLQNQSRVTLFKTHLDITLHNGEEFPLTLDEIVFEKGKNIYQLKGLTKLRGNNKVNFVIEADGFLTDPETKAQFYISTNTVDIVALPNKAIWDQSEISSGKLDLKIWADWKNSHFDSALISFNVNDFLMAFLDEPQISLSKFNSYLAWKRIDNGWQMELQNTEIIYQNKKRVEPSFFMEMSKLDNSKHYEITASNIDLGLWSDVLIAKPNLKPQYREQLIKMDLLGNIDKGIFSATTINSEIQNYKISAQIKDVGFQHWKNNPGLNKLSGHLHIEDNEGQISIFGKDSVLRYPSMFRWPININHFSSQLNWVISKDEIIVDVLNLEVDLLNMKLLADARYRINQKSKDMELDLYSEIDHADIANTKYLLPTSNLSKNLIDYLDQSIISGTLNNTKIAIRGPLSKFPFIHQEGVFKINAELADTQFSFHEQWPELTKMTGELKFFGNSMEINLDNAFSNGQKISNASVIIKDFSIQPTTLVINSHSQGLLEDGIDYIHNSPLAKSVGQVLNVIPARGPFDLNLNLIIPLDESGALVNGEIKLNDNHLILAPLNMPINRINGNLIIENSLISANNLSVELLGGTTSVNLSQSSDDSGRLTTKITSVGKVSSAELREIFPQFIPADIKGSTQYQSEIILPETSSDTDLLMNLDVRSDLVGFSSSLPFPLEKTAEQAEHFTLTHQLFRNDNQLITSSISNKVNLIISSFVDQASRGQIVFDDTGTRTDDAVIPENDGIELTGKVSKINLNDWLEIFNLGKNGYESNNKQNNAELNNFRVSNFNIKKLNYYFLSFDDVLVNTSTDTDSSKQAFQVNLKSDSISGEIVIPENLSTDAIDINLSKLMIADLFPEETLQTDSDDEAETSIESDELRAANTNILPLLNIQCLECIYNDKKLGRTLINIKPLENGNSFSLYMDSSTLLGLNIKGDWKTDKNNHVSTHLSGELNSKKLGDLISLININTGIHDTNAVIAGELSWQGDPMMFNTKSLFGKLNIKTGKGSQEDVSDKNARIFSLFSLGSIARRLTLDFSDLFGEGFFYTSMNGDFNIDKGVFTTSNFKINGTSADVEMKGHSDLPNDRIEQCILVTPDLSASLPILAGWAIEPVTGVLVFLMSKIFEPALKVVTGILYKVDGSFTNPNIIQLGKSQGTVAVDTTQQDSPTIIEDETVKPAFNCDGAFKN